MTTRPATGRAMLGDPRWARPALAAVLLGTAMLYLWGLGDSGWANSYYSAAVQAGTQSWHALFYGALDAAGAITVDKTPASLWVMGLSARIFGLSSWSLLVPQALMGVASVGLLYATVRRAFPAGAALLAALTLALTPAAALMFRFNNPDALLVLLLVGAAYATVRAIERGSARWLVLAGMLVGFGFLTKMLQALLVVPGFVLAYLVAVPGPVHRRIAHLLAAGLALVVAAGWWIVLVELTPAGARPWIGGSQTNSVLELTLGYNGLGRLSGDEAGSVGGGMGWGRAGWTRLLDPDNGLFLGWLLPATVILLVAGLWATGRGPSSAPRRGAYLLWGGWLTVTGLVFSFMQGIFHAYYTVALAPAVAALVGMGTATLWARRADPVYRTVLATTLGLTAVWSAVLLGRGGAEFAQLRYPVLVAGLAAASVLLAGGASRRRPVIVMGVLGVVAALSAPAAYAVSTASTPHTGAIPAVGPAATPGPGPGGLLGSRAPGTELVARLTSDSGSFTWVAAAAGANNAAGYQLATGAPVLALGGFNGSDPAPTLAQFQRYVAEGRIHYFLTDGPGLDPRGARTASGEIAEWVAARFRAVIVDGRAVYDLTART